MSSKLTLVNADSIEVTIKYLDNQRPIININNIITVDNTIFIGVLKKILALLFS